MLWWWSFPFGTKIYSDQSLTKLNQSLSVVAALSECKSNALKEVFKFENVLCWRFCVCSDHGAAVGLCEPPVVFEHTQWGDTWHTHILWGEQWPRVAFTSLTPYCGLGTLFKCWVSQSLSCGLGRAAALLDWLSPAGMLCPVTAALVRSSLETVPAHACSAPWLGKMGYTNLQHCPAELWNSTLCSVCEQLMESFAVCSSFTKQQVVWFLYFFLLASPVTRWHLKMHFPV